MSKSQNIEERIKRIEDKASDIDLTYYKDADGNYCICNIDWIGRFKTLEELENYLELF